jgi:hypothetical protein
MKFDLKRVRTHPLTSPIFAMLLSAFFIYQINFHGTGLYLAPIIIVSALSFLFIGIRAAFRGKWLNAASLMLAFLIFVFVFLSGESTRMFVDRLKVNFIYEANSECLSSSEIIRDDFRIGVCERHDLDSIETINTIIYDSSGEVQLPAGFHSKDWRNAAFKLGHKAPFGIMGFSARKIKGNFYDVQFSYSASPDLP